MTAWISGSGAQSPRLFRLQPVRAPSRGSEGGRRADYGAPGQTCHGDSQRRTTHHQLSGAGRSRQLERLRQCLPVILHAVIDRRGDGDASVQGVRRLYEVMAAEPRVTATAVQTVGAKGHDGFAIALVNAQS